MGIGKHTKEGLIIEQLREQVKLKNREIEEVKISCADKFREIYKTTEQNDLGNQNVKMKKVAEIAKDMQWQLMKDVAIENDVDSFIQDIKNKVTETRKELNIE